MPGVIPQRVLFEDHRLLQADDLVDEQQYHVYRRWQHNLAMHSWGILSGLEVTLQNPREPNRPGITVQRGMALDGYGREIVVMTANPDNTALDNSVSYDVWILYDVQRDEPVGTEDEEGCGSGADQLGRLSETPEILIQRSSLRPSGDVSQPVNVPVEDYHYAPFLPPKFDANASWPVFLGRLEYRETQWMVDQTERRYGGLIAERIEFPQQNQPQPMVDFEPNQGCCAAQDSTKHSVSESPNRRSRTILVNGGGDGSPNSIFAVHSESESPEGRSTATPISVAKVGTSEEELQIQLSAQRVVADADLVLQGGSALVFDTVPIDRRSTPENRQDAAEEGSILPGRTWGIFRQFQSASKSDGNGTGTTTSSANDVNSQQFADVLQFCIPQENRGNCIQIGSTDADGGFTPILEVKEDASVTVYGSLRVHGTIFGETTDLSAPDPEKEVPRIVDRAGTILNGPTAPKVELVGKLTEKIDDVNDTNLYANMLPKATSRKVIEAISELGEDKQVEYSTSLIPLAVNVLKSDDFATAMAKSDEEKLKELRSKLVTVAINELGSEVFSKAVEAGTGANVGTTLQRIVTYSVGQIPTKFVASMEAASGVKNVFEKLVEPILKKLDPAEFVGGMTGVGVDDKRKAVLTALATRSIDEVDLAEWVQAVDQATKNKEFLTELIPSSVKYVPVDKFASQLMTADKDERLPLLKKLITVAADDLDLDAAGFVDGVEDALLANRLEIYKALAPIAITVVNTPLIVDELATKKTKWSDLLKYLWTGVPPVGAPSTPHSSERVEELAKAMPTTEDELELFVRKLPEPNRAAMKAALQAAAPYNGGQ